MRRTLPLERKSNGIATENSLVASDESNERLFPQASGYQLQRKVWLRGLLGEGLSGAPVLAHSGDKETLRGDGSR